ncbi:hypothetical protein IID27_03595 [Patescibacteria group bacterium]|nr:hypothetical protein [Patescibacteria group bacterium]
MSEEKHNKKTFQNPDILKWVIVGLVSFIAVVLIFSTGVKVGTLKAKYSYRWADNYHKNFAGPRGGFVGDWRKFPAGDFIGGHGAFGEVIELNDSGFIIKGREDVEKIIVITEETIIKKGQETIQNGLTIGDRVTIIGSPNEEGQIEARFIRAFSKDETQILHKRPRFLFFR